MCSVPFAQSIVGLYFRNHGRPRIIVCLPSEVTRNLVLTRLDPRSLFFHRQCWMGPWEFGVLSMFLTGMGCSRGISSSLCRLANSESMNCPSAPESIRASVETFFPCTFSSIGIRIVGLFISDIITGAREIGGRSVSLILRVKNPLSPFRQRTGPWTLGSFQPSGV